MSHLHHKVSALIDGELQGSARRRALAHVRGCADCQRDIEETLALKRRLLGLRASEPSADLFASLDAAPLAAEPASVGAAAHGRSAPSVRRLLTGAGSVSVAVLSIAYVVGAPAEVATVSATPRVDDFTAEFASSAGVEPLADPSVQGLSLDPVPVPEAFSDVGLASVAAPMAPSEPSVPRGDEPAAVRLLEAAAIAPTLVAYAGVRRISTYDGAAPADIEVGVAHVPEQGTRFVVDDGTGKLGGPVFVAAGAPSDTGAPSAAELLQDSYDLAVLGRDTVAGRRAAVVGVGRDGMLTARLWIDVATGILLRRDVYADGWVARSSAFVEFRVRSNAFFEHVAPTLVQPDLQALPMDQAATFNDSGWTCPDTVVAGWHLTELDRVEAGAETLHAEYSDGLSSVSIYEQRGTLDAADLSGFSRQSSGGGSVYRRDGLPTQVVWQSGGVVYTVVTDAPAAVVDELLADLPRGAGDDDDDPGFGSRVGSGLGKMVEFLSPVG